jgi:predicted extracellular nuclease
VIGSLGLKAASDDNGALIAPARTFDTMGNSPIGGVYYSYEKYQVQVGQQLELLPGVDPALNSPPQAFDPDRGYGLVNYNLENLYDYRDDPFDACDFPGNPGTPDVQPPFDYVPASDAAYQARLQEIAAQIIGDLHAPDVLLVQEVEDQDIAAVVGGVLSFGEADNADGQPDVLQELAAMIAAQGGPSYQAAYDRGIVSAFLYRADRVQLLPASAVDPVLGAQPSITYRSPGLAYNGDVQNPKALNASLPEDVDISTGVDGENVFTRAPQVGLFRIRREGIGTSVFSDLYLISNHFSSGPDSRVGQRSEQAAYNAAIVAALQQPDPQVLVMVAGDLNVYPRPDDPFTPGQALSPSDQLHALYDRGLANLYDRLLAEVPASAYSYVYLGQAQTLDQMFVTPSLAADLEQVRVAHINGDWPSDYGENGPRGTSDHDPQVARYLLVPDVGLLEELVRHFAANGAIRGNNTERILLDRLERVLRFEERGTGRADEAQLRAFVNQVEGFAPRFIDQAAAEALRREAELLRTMP